MTRRVAFSGFGAFTLLELLAAVTVGVLLAGLLLSVAVSTATLWNRTNGNLATAAAARAVLDQIETDLRSAVIRDDGNVWLAATVLTATTQSGNWVNTSFGRASAESLVLDAETIADCRFGAAGVWLRMFAAPAAQPAGEVRAVGYQIVRRRQTSAVDSEVAYMLFRAAAGASQTLTAGYNLDPLSGGYRTPSGAASSAGNIIAPPLDTVIADHVVDFGVRFHAADATAVTPLFPAVAGMWTNAELTHLVRLGPTGTTETAKPAMVEIMLRILTEEGVTRIRAYENAPAGYVRSGTWWEIVEKHSTVYTRTVPLLSGSH